MTFSINKNTSDEACFRRLPAAIFLCYMAVGLPLPVISLFVHHELGLNSTLVGIAVGIQFLATVSTRGYAGRCADTRGARRTTLAGMISCSGAGLFYLCAALLPAPVWLRFTVLLLGRILLGYGESQMLTGVVVWGFGLLGPDRSGLVMAWIGMALYGALAVAAPLGLPLYGHWGLAALGVTTLVLPLLAYPLLRGIRSPAPAGGTRPPLHKVIGRIWLACVALFMQGIGFAVIGTFSALYFQARGWGNAGLALTCFGLAFVLMRVFFGKLPDTAGGSRVSMASFGCETVGLLMLWLAPHPAVAFLGAALTGAGCSLIFPSLGVEVVKLVPANVKGAAVGGFAAFQDISYGLGGPLGGLLAAGFGYAAVFLGAAACALAGLGATRILARRMRAAG